jgi:hypothetical protein
LSGDGADGLHIGEMDRHWELEAATERTSWLDAIDNATMLNKSKLKE